MFRRRIGVVVVVVVVVEDGLGEHAPKKTLFTQEKKFRFSMTTRVRSLTRKMHLFLSVSDLPRSHKARGKEHTQK